jgi:hypothetical protein
MFRKSKDNIKMDVKEAECKDVDSIHVAQDRNQCQALVNMVKNIHVP